MALLTNNVREWEPLWRSMLPVDEIFELVVDSAFVGMRKPDPEIYELTLERLGDGVTRRADCLFVDDIEVNVEAARDAGHARGPLRNPTSRRSPRSAPSSPFEPPQRPVTVRAVKRDAAIEAVFKPVRPPTTFEETVERLGGAIRTGVLTAGSRLPPERELAAELRISRSTLRQALTTLVQSGHLTSIRGRTGGTFVAKRPPLSEAGDEAARRSCRALLDHRVAVELGAVTLAAERAERAALDRLDDLVERMASPAGFDDYRRADISFHIGIAVAAASPRLVTEMTETQAQMSDLIARIAHPEEVLARSNAQHRRLVALLREGDAAARRGADHAAHPRHRAHPRRADLSSSARRSITAGLI